MKVRYQRLNTGDQGEGSNRENGWKESILHIMAWVFPYRFSSYIVRNISSGEYSGGPREKVFGKATSCLLQKDEKVFLEK